MELIQTTEIAEYSPVEAGLNDLRDRLENVSYDLTTTKGMAVAKADRAEVRTLRTGLEAKRKEIKAPALAHCKLIDEEAKRITAELLKLETPIDEQIKARETVVAAEKAAKEAAENARIASIVIRIATIKEYVALAAGCRTAARVDELLTKLSLISLADCEEFSDEAATAHLDTMERVIAIFDEKMDQEAEQARIKAEQAEATAKLAAERAEFEATQAAAKAEADRVAAEQAAITAAAKAKADEAAALLDQQRAELAAEAKRQSDILTAQQKAQAAERQKFAEEKAAFEAQVAEAKRLTEQAEQDRLDALPKVEVLAAPEPEKTYPIFPLSALAGQAPDFTLEHAQIASPAIETVAHDTEPSDADVMWTAIKAVATAYGWTTEQATTRLAAVWTL